MSFGDSLGRLAAPATAARFEGARLAMVDTLVAASAAGPVPHAAWAGAFAAAVDEVAAGVVGEADRAVAAAVVHSRMPARLQAGWRPREDYRETLTQRLLAAGVPLERLEHAPVDEATVRSRGAALEGAWDEVIRLAAEELERWRGLAIAVREWRRPTTALWVATGATLAVTCVAAAWLGGLAEAPGWFDPVAQAFWGVGWW